MNDDHLNYKELPVSWQEVHIQAKKLAERLRQTGKSWEKIVAVTRGGLVPACLIARDLDIRLIDTISIASYAHQDQSAAKILKFPDNCGTGKNILVIDDLSDTGNTFRAIREKLPEATYACIYVKPAGKPLADAYASEVKQDCWIYFPWEDQDFSSYVRGIIGTHLENIS
ncbi:MAG: xanthine phosphoribosyltransferase [Pseudobdellovibrionaceae bacterium]